MNFYITVLNKGLEAGKGDLELPDETEVFNEEENSRIAAIWNDTWCTGDGCYGLDKCIPKVQV